MSCPRCAEGYVLPGEPRGSMQPEFKGAYLATPNGKTTASKQTVVLLTDVFGLQLNNCKIIADALAEKLQCDVWVPDYFNGRPLFHVDAMAIPDTPDERMTLWKWIQFIFRNIIPNLGAHWSSRPSVVDERVSSFISMVKEKRGYEKVGAVGYCYGASTCIRLASTTLVNGVVICHPGPFSLAQIKAIRVPTSWVCAQVDEFMADSKKAEAEAELARRKGTDAFVDYEFITYKGTTHGFACRPNLLARPELLESYEKALDQTASWFEKTLIVDPKLSP